MDPRDHSLPLASSVIQPSEHECINTVGSDAQHSHFVGGQESLGPTPGLLSLSQAPDSRLLPTPVTQHTVFPSSSMPQEPAPGSIITSSNPNLSPLEYTQLSSGGTNFHPHTHSHSALGLAVPYTSAPSLWTSVPSYSYTGSSSDPLNGVSHAGTRHILDEPSAILATATTVKTQKSGSNSKSPKSPLPSSIRGKYISATPGLNRHFDHKPASSLGKSYTSSALDTPQVMLPPHSNMAFNSNHPPYGSSTYNSTQTGSFNPTQPAAYNPTTSPAAYHHQTPPQPQAPIQTAPSPPPIEPRQREPPFREQVDFYDIQTGDGQKIKSRIIPRSERGFFWCVDGWTSYRRNYFTVNCSYRLEAHPGIRPLYLIKRSHDTTPPTETYEQIQAFAMCLSAAVDGSTGKPVDLVQHTPKRDKGPQCSVQKVKICPLSPHARTGSPDPGETQVYPLRYGADLPKPPTLVHINLPLQLAPDPFLLSHPDDDAARVLAHNPTAPTATSHTFERIQFKNATANNGKRRAQQQYFHLKVELWADIRRSPDMPPKWVRVASRASPPVVVRGRSPSHYQGEANRGHRGGSAGGGGGGGGAIGRSTWINMPWAPVMPGTQGNQPYTPASYSYGGNSGSSYTVSCPPSTQIPSMHSFVSMQPELGHMIRTLRQTMAHDGSVHSHSDSDDVAVVKSDASEKFQYWPLSLVEPVSRAGRNEHSDSHGDDMGHYYQPVSLST